WGTGALDSRGRPGGGKRSSRRDGEADGEGRPGPRATPDRVVAARGPIAGLRRADMGFLNGRVTYVRFRVGGDSPLPIGQDLLELANQHAIGRHGAGEPTDGISVG